MPLISRSIDCQTNLCAGSPTAQLRDRLRNYKDVVNKKYRMTQFDKRLTNFLNYQTRRERLSVSRVA